MKTLFSFACLFTSLIFAREGYTGDMNSMVENEIQAAQNEAKTQLNLATERLAKLRAYKLQAVSESKRKGETELNGKKLMDKYGALLVAKYHNEKDEFEPGMPINEKDQLNISKLFQSYLFTQPFKGVISAGEAKRILEIGAKNLDEMAKNHLNPTEKNNSQLEILEYQVQNAELIVKKANNLVLALGLTTPAGTAPRGERVPASTVSVTPKPQPH